jgi:hypothetical protein
MTRVREIAQRLALLQDFTQPDPARRERPAALAHFRDGLPGSLGVMLLDGAQLRHWLAVLRNDDSLASAHPLEQCRQVGFRFVGADLGLVPSPRSD